MIPRNKSSFFLFLLYHIETSETVHGKSQFQAPEAREMS
jgi:hypothetical protein